jgi:hypothetical protein
MAVRLAAHVLVHRARAVAELPDYVDERRPMAAVHDGRRRAALDPKTPIEVFDGVCDFQSDTGLSHAIDPKQDRFLMIQLSDDSAISSMVVVLNWFDELRRLTNTER